MKIYALILVLMAYALLNLFVYGRINKAFYFDEKRRLIHKRMIWIIPFLGPVMIRSFWKTHSKTRMDVMTKKDRKNRSGGSLDSAGPVGPNMV